MKIFRFGEYIAESLPQSKSVEQLAKVRKISKGTDIGDKIADMTSSANIDYIRNPIDTGIETYQDYMFNNKDFDMNNPLKNQTKGPAISYVGPLSKPNYKEEKVKKHDGFKVTNLNKDSNVK